MEDNEILCKVKVLVSKRPEAMDGIIVILCSPGHLMHPERMPGAKVTSENNVRVHPRLASGPCAPPTPAKEEEVL